VDEGEILIIFSIPRGAAGDMRGISRVAVEVVLLVVAVAVVLLMFSPAGSMISSTVLRGTTTWMPPSQLEIVSIWLTDQEDCDLSGDPAWCIEIAVKNLGPHDIDLDSDDDGRLDWGAWVLIMDDYYCGEAWLGWPRPPYAVEESQPDGVMSVGEVVYVRWDDNWCSRYFSSTWGYEVWEGIHVVRTGRYLVKLYGPEGVLATGRYAPLGG